MAINWYMPGGDGVRTVGAEATDVLLEAVGIPPALLERN